MAGSQISTGITIINSLLGYMGISITNQDTSAATAIATGSKVEVAGAFFTFGSDETPTASTWTSITTGTTAYIALTPSGTAGSQIVSASWVTSGSVVWSDAKQGYYTSAASNIRVVASAYKTSATQYDYKKVLTEKRENIIPFDGAYSSVTLSALTAFTTAGLYSVVSNSTDIYFQIWDGSAWKSSDSSEEICGLFIIDGVTSRIYNSDSLVARTFYYKKLI